MYKNKNILTFNIQTLKLLSLTAMFLIPTINFAQDNKSNESRSSTERVELNYKQRHSRANSNNLYADGIKIKRDLSILKEVQEERVLAEGEIPSEELYGGIWNNRYVNAYRSINNIPDTFNIDLSRFTMPTMGHVTSNFGPRWRRMHYGIDLKVYVGDTIYAAFDGKVRVKQYEQRGYGYYLALRHPNGLETVYGHLSEFLVNEDDIVKSGDPIALGGNTGRSTGAHLHFEVRFLGKPINPAKIIDFQNKVCHQDNYLVTSSTFSYPASNKGININDLASSSYSKSKENKYTSGKVTVHRIKKGETLGVIAKKYGLTLNKLCALNNITAKTKVRPGKSLRIS